MISFRVVNTENREEEINRFCKLLGNAITQELAAIIDNFVLSPEEDAVYAFSYVSGCALVRIFDLGRYFFAFPYEITEDADVSKAIDEIFEYAIKEGLNVEFTDVAAESLHLFKGYRHITLDAEDCSAEVYRVKIHTECTLLDEIPELIGERVTLNRILIEDVPLYAKLAKDGNINKYWGYDYKADNPNPKDEYFLETANMEFMSGVAISFAIRYCGEFVGEAQIYSFDGKGNAEFAIRLFSEFHGKGIASSAADLIYNFAASVGMTSLKAQIMKENIASISFAKKTMQLLGENGRALVYIRYL